MRRRLERFIPIVLLALFAQLVAPVSAFHFVAHAVSDPLYLSSICSHTSSDSDQSLPSDSSDHGDCCIACGMGLGGAVGIAPPQQIFIALHRQYQQVVWLEPMDALSAIRRGSNAQARAPPKLS